MDRALFSGMRTTIMRTTIKGGGDILTLHAKLGSKFHQVARWMQGHNCARLGTR